MYIFKSYLNSLSSVSVQSGRQAVSVSKPWTANSKTPNCKLRCQFSELCKCPPWLNEDDGETCQFRSISSIVLRGKVSVRPVCKDESWALLKIDSDWRTESEGEVAVSSRQLELRWRSWQSRDRYDAERPCIDLHLYICRTVNQLLTWSRSNTMNFMHTQQKQTINLLSTAKTQNGKTLIEMKAN